MGQAGRNRAHHGLAAGRIRRAASGQRTDAQACGHHVGHRRNRRCRGSTRVGHRDEVVVGHRNDRGRRTGLLDLEAGCDDRRIHGCAGTAAGGGAGGITAASHRGRVRHGGVVDGTLRRRCDHEARGIGGCDVRQPRGDGAHHRLAADRVGRATGGQRPEGEACRHRVRDGGSGGGRPCARVGDRDRVVERHAHGRRGGRDDGGGLGDFQPWLARERNVECAILRHRRDGVGVGAGGRAAQRAGARVGARRGGDRGNVACSGRGEGEAGPLPVLDDLRRRVAQGAAGDAGRDDPDPGEVRGDLQVLRAHLHAAFVAGHAGASACPALEERTVVGHGGEVGLLPLAQVPRTAGRPRAARRAGVDRGNGIEASAAGTGGVGGEQVLRGTHGRAEAIGIVGGDAVRHPGGRRHADHRHYRRTGRCRGDAVDGIDQRLAHRQVGGGRRQGAGPTAGGAAAGRAAARDRTGPGGGAVRTAQALRKACAVGVDRTMVGHGDRVGHRAADQVGRHVAVADTDAQVDQRGARRRDRGLDERPDERADRIRAHIVVAVVDDVVRAGRRRTGGYGERHREAAAGAGHEIADRTVDVVRARGRAGVGTGTRRGKRIGDERERQAVFGDRRREADDRTERIDARVVDVVVGVGDLLTGLGRRRADGGHAETRHLRTEHVHVDLGGVVGGACGAVRHVDLQPYLVADVQPSVARRDVEALPVGELVGTERLPGNAGLVRIVEGMEELGVALRQIDDFDEEERLLACGMVGIVEHRRHREAQVDLAVDGIDVAQHHRRLLLHRIRGARTVATQQRRRGAGEGIARTVATGVGGSAGRGEDADIAAEGGVDRVAAGNGLLHRTQGQLAAVGRRHDRQGTG